MFDKGWRELSQPTLEEKDMKRTIFDVAYALVSLVLLLAYGVAVAKAQNAHSRLSIPIFLPASAHESPTRQPMQEGMHRNQSITQAAAITCKENDQLPPARQQNENTCSKLAENLHAPTPSGDSSHIQSFTISGCVLDGQPSGDFTLQAACPAAQPTLPWGSQKLHLPQ